jgi:hypothetical protein
MRGGDDVGLGVVAVFLWFMRVARVTAATPHCCRL